MKNFITLHEFIESTKVRRPLLGIDWGAKKIGLSISDDDKSFIFPAGIIKNDAAAIQKIVEIIQKRNACGIVIGNPLKLDGTDGNNTAATQSFAEELLKASSLPILFQDERFTTKLARGNIRKPLHEDDSAAACHILRTVIEMLQNYL